MICPKDCAKKSDLKVYGYDIFADHSSICRAAIMMEAIKDEEGGEINVIV